VLADNANAAQVVSGLMQAQGELSYPPGDASAVTLGASGNVDDDGPIPRTPDGATVCIELVCAMGRRRVDCYARQRARPDLRLDDVLGRVAQLCSRLFPGPGATCAVLPASADGAVFAITLTMGAVHKDLISVCTVQIEGSPVVSRSFSGEAASAGTIATEPGDEANGRAAAEDGAEEAEAGEATTGAPGTGLHKGAPIVGAHEAASVECTRALLMCAVDLARGARSFAHVGASSHWEVVHASVL